MAKKRYTIRKDEPKKRVHKVMLTQDEISEAYSFLYDEFGPIIQIWTDEKKDEMLCNYWLDRGKQEEDEL